MDRVPDAEFGYWPQTIRRWHMDPKFPEEALERRSASVVTRDASGVMAERYLSDCDDSSIPHCIRPLFEQGGYVPHLAHLVPPDIPYRHYSEYLEKKRRLIGR